jgi:hypothetical protein
VNAITEIDVALNKVQKLRAKVEIVEFPDNIFPLLGADPVDDHSSGCRSSLIRRVNSSLVNTTLRLPINKPRLGMHKNTLDNTKN